MSDIVFLDTETLGLDPDAPIWEFAAIRRSASGIESPVEFFIDHDPGGWLEELPDQFLDDYGRRYDPLKSFTERDAARLISSITANRPHIIGAVPSFDTERIAKLLQRNGIEPSWHYHLIDVENVVVGWLHGVAARAIDESLMRGEQPDAALTKRTLDPPWKSDELSRAVGVDPNDYDRHTAMGDVLWAKAQWDAITGRAKS